MTENHEHRIPPHSEEAEKGVLGSVLIEAERCFDVIIERGITPESFYIPAHRTIFEAISGMGRKNRPIDLLTVIEILKRCGTLDEIGGSITLDRLVDNTPTAAHCEYYAEVVKEKETLRGIIAAARQAEDEAYEAENAEELRSKTEYAMATLKAQKLQRKDTMTILTEKNAEWRMAQQSGCVGVQTGFALLDSFFGGLLEGAFNVISGTPSSGKTTLTRNICENVSMRGIPVLFFSLEQTAGQILGASEARMAKQSVYRLNMGGKNCDFDALEKWKPIIAGWPLYVLDEPQTATTLWSASRSYVSKKKVRLIVVDYLQIMSAGNQKFASDESRISYFSDTCRAIAKELRVTVIANSALSNAGNLRGSGMIGYDAWAHITLDNDDTYVPAEESYTRKIANFKKQRFGPPASQVPLILIGNEQRFVEEASLAEDQEAERQKSYGTQEDLAI